MQIECCCCKMKILFEKMQQSCQSTCHICTRWFRISFLVYIRIACFTLCICSYRVVSISRCCGSICTVLDIHRCSGILSTADMTEQWVGGLTEELSRLDHSLASPNWLGFQVACWTLLPGPMCMHLGRQIAIHADLEMHWLEELSHRTFGS